MTPAASFLGSFGRALAAVALYGYGHPAVEHATDRAWQDLEGLLTGVPRVVFTFLGETVLVGNMPIVDLHGWEWSERLSSAGVQRVQFDAPFSRGELSAFLSQLLDHLSGAGQPAAASTVVRGVRYGAVGLRGEALAATPMPAATLALSLDDEFEATRWIEQEVRGNQSIPLLETETIVRSLSVAMHGGQQAMLPLIDLKHYDEYSTTHSLNVSLLAMGLAERLNLASREVHDYGMAALLHDIGKTLVPLDVLRKPDRHTDAEREIMTRHPADGARLILHADQGLDLAAVVAYEHHITHNADGYPKLRFGRTAHPASRLVRVCDVFDALRTHRPYRDAWPLDKTIAFLREQAGTGFDPACVEPFVQMILETAPSSTVTSRQ